RRPLPVPPRLEVFDLRHLVGPAGHDAGHRRLRPDDPPAGTRHRVAQQARARTPVAAERARPRADAVGTGEGARHVGRQGRAAARRVAAAGVAARAGGRRRHRARCAARRSDRRLARSDDDRVGAGRAAREHHVAPDRARARSAPSAVRTDDRSRGDAGRNRAAADAESRARPADRGPRPAEAARRARPGRLNTMVRLAVVLLAVAGATSVLPARSGPAGTPDQAGVVFFEGFDAASLDRSAWNVITDFHVNNEQQAYIDSPDTIAIVTGDEARGADGGALRLRALYRPGETRQLNRTFDFVSGRIDTRDKVTFTHGTAAARIRLTAGEGLWPAFWAL